MNERKSDSFSQGIEDNNFSLIIEGFPIVFSDVGGGSKYLFALRSMIISDELSSE
jgi:hypothetical protein